MIIGPPRDDDFTIHTPDPENRLSEEKFRDFVTAIPWMCPKCGLKNHGWNKRCANFRCKIERPVSV